jgi:GT2 family glycosyltransferase
VRALHLRFKRDQAKASIFALTGNMTENKVSIVITTYRPESKRYLDLCIQSIKNLDYPPDLLDVILVGKPGYIPEYEGVRSMAPELPEFHNPVGVNFGMKAAATDSQYVMLLNDDVILTRDCLKNMVASMPNDNCVMGATSNCDNFWKYLLTVGYSTTTETFVLEKRYYVYEELEPHFHGLMNTNSAYPQGLMITDSLCLYANLIPKKLWDDLEGFDEGFKTGYDDTDFCLRARQKGATMVIALDSVIFHFGGASTNHTLTPEIREETKRYFFEKWGKK